MFELFRHFKGNVISLHTVTSSCVLISRHDHVGYNAYREITTITLKKKLLN